MRRVVVAFAVALGLAAIPAAGVRAATIAPDSCAWTSFRNGVANHGASTCTSIGTGNVATLHPRWVYRTRDSVTATPAVADGRLFVGAWDGTFYAFDTEAEGVGDPTLTEAGVPDLVEPAWTFPIDDRNGVSFGRIVSSATVTAPVRIGPAGPTDRLVIFTGGATLYVLRAEDASRDGRGDLVAKLCLDPRLPQHTPHGRCRGTAQGQVESEASPVVVRVGPGVLRVLVGTDVHNDPKVGRTGVTAVDLDLRRAIGSVSSQDGRPSSDATNPLRAVWKYDPEGLGPGDRDGATYWPDGGDVITRGSGTGDGCGGVWGTPAVDVDADVVLLGVSSCRAETAPGPDGVKGTADDAVDTVAGEKVDAVRLSDGAFLWRYAPARRWGSRADDDFGTAPQLYRAQVDRDPELELVAGAAGKDGWYYALDAVTGRLVWKTQVGQPGHTNEDFAIGGMIGSPAVGAVAGRPTLFLTTAISTPVGAPVDYGTPDSIDASLAEDPARLLSIHAVDAATGAFVWRQVLTRQTYAHPTYANGLLFVPSTTSLSVQAYDAATGIPLWTGPLNGPPSSGVALTDRGIYLGTGTRQTDAGFKLFGTDSAVPPEIQTAVPPPAADLVGSDPQARVAGIWALSL